MPTTQHRKSKVELLKEIITMQEQQAKIIEETSKALNSLLALAKQENDLLSSKNASSTSSPVSKGSPISQKRSSNNNDRSFEIDV